MMNKNCYKFFYGKLSSNCIELCELSIQACFEYLFPALKKFHPHLIHNDATSPKCVEEWKRLAKGKNIHELTIDAYGYECILEHVEVPTNLKKVTIKMSTHSTHGGTNPPCMQKVFPPTVVSLHLVPAPYMIVPNELQFYKGDVLLNKFPNVKKLEVNGKVLPPFTEAAAPIFRQLTHYKGDFSCFEVRFVLFPMAFEG